MKYADHRNIGLSTVHNNVIMTMLTTDDGEDEDKLKATAIIIASSKPEHLEQSLTDFHFIHLVYS